MQIINYSDKAIAVIGGTKPYAESLKALGGKFNPWLKCGAGWIFSAKRRAQVEALVSRIESRESVVDTFDMALEDRMAEAAGVGSNLSSRDRGNY